MLFSRSILLLLILVTLSVEQVFAQQYSISGIVQEAKTDERIAYATVAAYNEVDSKLVTGIITDERGMFDINIDEPGNYYIKINVLGFGEHIINNIQITDANNQRRLGVINITPEATNLNEVIINAERDAIEYKVDRKVVNIEKLGISGNLPLSEALQVLPFIETDSQGNVSLRGSQNFQVLIDGKPTALSGSEALQQFSSDQIEKIEVITNPSAKYEANNTSGIINLVLKKGEGLGLSGIVSLGRVNGLGEKQPINGNSTLSYRNKKYSLTSSFNYTDRLYDFNWHHKQIRDSGTIVDLFRSNSVPWGQGRASLDFDYFITDNHTLTLAGRTMKRDNEFDIKAENYLLNSEVLPFFSRVRGATDRRTHAITLYDALKFDSEGHVLKSLFTYFNRSINSPQTFSQYADLTREEETHYRIFNTSDSHDQFQFKMDYTKPINSTRELEAGVNLLTISRRSNTEAETFLPDPVLLAANEFLLKNNTYAGYVTYKDTIKGEIEFQAGLRLEHYDRLIEQRGSIMTYDYKKLNVFPSAHILKKIKEKQELKLSYSRRIKRPSMFDLQPYLNWSDNFFSFGGNPNLIPANINVSEISYTLMLKNVTIITEVYYRNTINEITRRGILNPETGIVEASPANIDNSRIGGIECSFDIKANSWLKLLLSGTYFKGNLEGQIFDTKIGEDYDGWRLRINNKIDLPKSIKLNINGYYNSESYDVRGLELRDPWYWMDVSLSTTFLEKKGTVAINFRDAFGSRTYNSTAQREGYRTVFRMKLAGRQVLGINLSYKFNSFKKKENQFDFED